MMMWLLFPFGKGGVHYHALQSLLGSYLFSRPGIDIYGPASATGGRTIRRQALEVRQ
jgi:hypothetical protein